MHAVIVGAGLAGLVAATELTRAGHSVTILDKGRSVGGRLATRRIDGAVLDHGAQFFTVRSATFAAMVEPLISEGLVTEWCRGFSAEGDGYPRYSVRGGMNALAKRLASDLAVTGLATIRCPAMVFAIRPASESAKWNVGLDDGEVVSGDAVVVTCPLPQSYSLLITTGMELPEDLMRMEYDRTIGLLAVLDGPSAVPFPGGVQGGPGDFFSFVADNAAKGLSSLNALTLHANAEWSEAHWGDSTTALDAALRAEATPLFGGAGIATSQVKKWRFATPRTPSPDACWSSVPGDGRGGVAPVVLAGDAFAGPKVEGAALSGRAAALALLDHWRS